MGGQGVGRIPRLVGGTRSREDSQVSRGTRSREASQVSRGTRSREDSQVSRGDKESGGFPG